MPKLCKNCLGFMLLAFKKSFDLKFTKIKPVLYKLLQFSTIAIIEKLMLALFLKRNGLRSKGRQVPLKWSLKK